MPTTLIFNEVSWDGKGLMHVELNHRGQLYRWYPRWAELEDILNSAMATEGVFNNGRLKPYLIFMIAKMLLRHIIVDPSIGVSQDISSDTFANLDSALETIRSSFLNRQAHIREGKE